MVDSIAVPPTSEPTGEILEVKKTRYDSEEKVEVIIKEVIRIKPADFQAFKRALEEFVGDWDK